MVFSNKVSSGTGNLCEQAVRAFVPPGNPRTNLIKAEHLAGLFPIPVLSKTFALSKTETGNL